MVGGFSPGTPVSSTNKTDRHHITEILLNELVELPMVKRKVILRILHSNKTGDPDVQDNN
jgi:hypothetical protein